MKIGKYIAIGLAVCSLAAMSKVANAVSVYSASGSLSLSLTTTVADGLDGLAYLGSRVTYDALAVAVSDGAFRVDSALIPVVKTASPPVSFGTTFANGKDLRNLLLDQSTGPQVTFPGVVAILDGAEAKGGNTITSPGKTIQVGANVSGKATDEVESGTSLVIWELLIDYQNTSTETILAEWTISYLLSNSASADPRGSAFSSTQVKAQGGSIIGGRRNRTTSVFDRVTAACSRTEIDCGSGGTINETKVFRFLIPAGGSAYFNVLLDVFGDATVVPLPAALPLFTTGLAFMGFVGWRRKRKAKAVTT